MLTRTLYAFQDTKYFLERRIMRFLDAHPYLALGAAALLMPALILLAVWACTTAVVLPFAWLLGLV